MTLNVGFPHHLYLGLQLETSVFDVLKIIHIEFLCVPCNRKNILASLIVEKYIMYVLSDRMPVLLLLLFCTKSTSHTP